MWERPSSVLIKKNNIRIISLTKIYLTDLTIQNEEFNDGPDGQPFTKQEILKVHLNSKNCTMTYTIV
jgi:hypothetical protein